MSEAVHCERRDALDVVRLAAPERRNVMTIAMLDALREAVASSAAGDTRGLVIDHEGPVFCAGVDLRERRSLPEGVPSHSELLAALLRELVAYPKPVLCRVDGAARGGGMGLVAASDVVIAGAAASFAFSEVRVGVAPALVGALALRKTTVGHLSPWLLTGTPFDAETAARIGLVSIVAGDTDAALAETCAAIREAAPGALRATKKLPRTVAATPEAELVDEMERLSTELFRSAEAREGMAAFAERRRPSWADG